MEDPFLARDALFTENERVSKEYDNGEFNYIVPEFFSFDHKSTKWIITLLSSTEGLKRLSVMARENCRLFTTYFQIPDNPSILGKNIGGSQSTAYYPFGVLYLTPLGLAIYMKKTDAVRLLLKLKDESGKRIIHPNEICFVQQRSIQQSPDKPGNDLQSTYPALIAIRRGYYEGITLLMNAGYSPQKDFGIIWRRGNTESLSIYRDLMDYAMDMLKTKPGHNIAILIQTITKSTVKNFYDIYMYDIEVNPEKGEDEWISIFRRIAQLGVRNNIACGRNGVALISVLDVLQKIGFLRGLISEPIEDKSTPLPSRNIGSAMSAMVESNVKMQNPIRKISRVDMLSEPRAFELVSHDRDASVGTLIHWYQLILKSSRQIQKEKIEMLIARCLSDTEGITAFFGTENEETAEIINKWIDQDCITTDCIRHLRTALLNAFTFVKNLYTPFVKRFGYEPKDFIKKGSVPYAVRDHHDHQERNATGNSPPIEIEPEHTENCQIEIPNTKEAENSISITLHAKADSVSYETKRNGYSNIDKSKSLKQPENSGDFQRKDNYYVGSNSNAGDSPEHEERNITISSVNDQNNSRHSKDRSCKGSIIHHNTVPMAMKSPAVYGYQAQASNVSEKIAIQKDENRHIAKDEIVDKNKSVSSSKVEKQDNLDKNKLVSSSKVEKPSTVKTTRVTGGYVPRRLSNEKSKSTINVKELSPPILLSEPKSRFNNNSLKKSTNKFANLYAKPPTPSVNIVKTPEFIVDNISVQECDNSNSQSSSSTIEVIKTKINKRTNRKHRKVYRKINYVSNPNESSCLEVKKESDHDEDTHSNQAVIEVVGVHASHGKLKCVEKSTMQKYKTHIVTNHHNSSKPRQSVLGKNKQDSESSILVAFENNGQSLNEPDQNTTIVEEELENIEECRENSVAEFKENNETKDDLTSKRSGNRPTNNVEKSPDGDLVTGDGYSGTRSIQTTMSALMKQFVSNMNVGGFKSLK